MERPHAIVLRREPGPLVRSLVALSLRVALGLVFLMAGLGKFEAKKAEKYPQPIIDQFKDTKLPPSQVKLFANVLPYAEVTIGAWLISGLLTPIGATLSAVLLAHLLFGQTVLGNSQAFPGMLTYFLVNAGILWLSPVTSNYLSLDGLFFGWFWAPRHEGHFAAAEAADTSRKENVGRG